MSSGQWVHAGKLKFYISDKKICVTDDFQYFRIDLIEKKHKGREEILVGKIMLGGIDNWCDLYEAMNDHDEFGDISKRIFQLVYIRKEWI